MALHEREENVVAPIRRKATTAVLAAAPMLLAVIETAAIRRIG